jgi:hypothetical protein
MSKTTDESKRRTAKKGGPLPSLAQEHAAEPSANDNNHSCTQGLLLPFSKQTPPKARRAIDCQF